MDNDDSILMRYLDGLLSIPEKEAFEKELDSSPHLRDELENARISREAVRLYGLKQQVGHIHADMMNEFAASRKKAGSTRKLLRYSIAIAASLLLILGLWVGYNFITLSSEKVYGSKYQAYELVNLRDNRAEDPIEKAYRNRDYKLVQKLSSAEKTMTAESAFLSGLASLELNDNVKAIERFKTVLAENAKNKKSDFNDEAEYYLALAYIRNKDYDFALDLLRSIKNDPAHLYNKKITSRFLRQVRMLKWR